MKVTYNEILGAHQAIQALTQNGTILVTPLMALRLARAARVLTQETQAFEAGRIALVKQYALEPDKQGNQVVQSEHVTEFNKQLTELAKQEVEIDVQALSLADFGDSKIPTGSFRGIEWLIEDDVMSGK